MGIDVQVPPSPEDLETSIEIMVIVTLVIVVTSHVSISVTSVKVRKILVITMAVVSETAMQIMVIVTLVTVVIVLVSISVTSANKTVVVLVITQHPVWDVEPSMENYVIFHSPTKEQPTINVQEKIPRKLGVPLELIQMELQLKEIGKIVI